jgi:hypothetical protein
MYSRIILSLLIVFSIGCHRKDHISGDATKSKEDELPWGMKIVDDSVASNAKSAGYKTKMDSTYALIDGTFAFPSDIENSLPANSNDYFKAIRFPYSFPEQLAIDFFCEKIPFSIKDSFVFNKKNESAACELIALIDTVNYSKVIARRCAPMEGWITLYVFNKDYKILSSAMLINSGGELLGGTIDFENGKVTYIGSTDSLKYSRGIFNVIHQEVYQLTDNVTGKVSKEIGYQQIKTLLVSEDGKVIQKYTVTTNKRYVESLKESRGY